MCRLKKAAAGLAHMPADCFDNWYLIAARRPPQILIIGCCPLGTTLHTSMPSRPVSVALQSATSPANAENLWVCHHSEQRRRRRQGACMTSTSRHSRVYRGTCTLQGTSAAIGITATSCIESWEAHVEHVNAGMDGMRGQASAYRHGNDEIKQSPFGILI